MAVASAVFQREQREQRKQRDGGAFTTAAPSVSAPGPAGDRAPAVPAAAVPASTERAADAGLTLFWAVCTRPF